MLMGCAAAFHAVAARFRRAVTGVIQSSPGDMSIVVNTGLIADDVCRKKYCSWPVQLAGRLLPKQQAWHR
jgi:hypothetical protein